MKDELFVLMVITIVFLSLFLLFWGLGELECSSIGNTMERDYKYTFISGCYIDNDGQWVREKRFRGID